MIRNITSAADLSNTILNMLCVGLKPLMVRIIHQLRSQLCSLWTYFHKFQSLYCFPFQIVYPSNHRVEIYWICKLHYRHEQYMRKIMSSFGNAPYLWCVSRSCISGCIRRVIFRVRELQYIWQTLSGSDLVRSSILVIYAICIRIL